MLMLAMFLISQLVAMSIVISSRAPISIINFLLSIIIVPIIFLSPKSDVCEAFTCRFTCASSWWLRTFGDTLRFSFSELIRDDLGWCI